MIIRSARPLARLTIIASAALVAACSSGGSGKRADVEIRGTNPNQTLSRNPPAAANPAPADNREIVTVGPGVTLAGVARANGLSVSELAAYNGVQPNHAFRPGDAIVLPPKPAGQSVQVADAGVAALPRPLPPKEPALAATPLAAPDAANAGVGLDAPAAAVDALDAGTPNVETPDLAAGDLTDDLTAPGAAAPASAPAAPVRSNDWSPDDIETALNQRLGKPPSANSPIPPEPSPQRDLESPGLGRYQTETSLSPNPEPDAPEAATPAETDLAAADPAAPNPAPARSANPNIKLAKPVIRDGRVAIAFNKGAGGVRNDGVDFAVPAGSPVFAADDGEVALVSQSLGGLGTIILVRHQNELLTVYGRVDDVKVGKGDTVRRGQTIGVVSNAAAPAEPRMHFEVRRGAESLNPMDFL